MANDVNDPFELEPTAQYVQVPRPFEDTTDRDAARERELAQAAEKSREHLLSMVGRDAAEAAGAQVNGHRWPTNRGRGTHRRGGERDAAARAPIAPDDADEIAAIGQAMIARVNRVVDSMPSGRGLSGLGRSDDSRS